MADRPPPTSTSLLLATALLAAISGYMIGIASSLGFLPIPSFLASNAPRKTGRTAGYDNEEESSEEEIDVDEGGHAPDWSAASGRAVGGQGVEGVRRRGGNAAGGGGEGIGRGPKKGAKEERNEVEDSGEECKLVLVVRTDLGMTKGKIAAQSSHATLACYKTLSTLAQRSPSAASILKRWEKYGQAKIAVQVKSEDELLTLQAMARSLGVVSEVIADAGRTQIASGSLTVLGVGPAPKSMVDGVTGGLKLL